ncbi:MAG: A24 family peptidase [Calditrichia bacterium]
MVYALLFIVGAVIGSFLNVVIYRLPRKISLVKPDSFCPQCEAPIPTRFNIPILGYIILRGKCYYCHQKISFGYFFVELISGIVSVFTFLKFGFTPGFFFYLIFIYFLIVISFIDLSTQLIYNKLLIALLGFGVLFNLLFSVIAWSQALTGVVIGGASLFLFALLGQFLFKKESMGMGDVKLAAVMGFFLGWKMVLLALLIGFCYAFLAFIFLSFSKTERFKEYVPMAPFLALSTITFIYWGPALIQWYWNLFLPVH